MSLPSNIYTVLLTILGGFVLFFFLLNTLWSLIQQTRALLAPFLLPHEETSLIKKYGTWALITGCTDGIGKAYATELAKEGFNLVLISRNEEKLKKTSNEIEKNFSVKTKIVTADFGTGKDAIQVIKEELGLLDIGLVVNNVGKQYDYPMYLEEVSEKDLWEIININVGAVTLLCRLYVNQMKKRKRGAIVNISSGSEMQPLPLMTVYAATKAYMKSFTSALRCEYAKDGITIQHLSPMFINTKMNQFSKRLQKSTLFVPDANTYAKHALRTLGKADETTGYWPHGLQYFLTSIPPIWIRTLIGSYLNKSFRKEYLSDTMQ